VKFVAIDWGTSSFRAWLIENDQVSDQIETDKGVKNFTSGSHASYLDEVLRIWQSKYDFIVSIGMIGSNIGLHEVIPNPLPIDLTSLSNSLVKVPDFSPALFIVPGASKPGDVMRGEESQALSAGVANGLVISPGTHSKWVEIKDGRITNFQTHLTGELFELLRNHSTLSKATQSTKKLDASQDFVAGLNADSSDLLHQFFSIRANWIQGKSEDASREYLSGLLIGSEIKSAMRSFHANEANLVASKSLAEIYIFALAHFGITAKFVNERALTDFFVELAKKVELKS